MSEPATTARRGHLIHLWRAPLDRAPPEVGALAPLLSTSEIDRAGRFRHERERRRFVVARAALRQVLSHYLGAAPRQLRFTYSDVGKPEIERAQNPDDLRFNLAHSHELALVAVSQGIRVGVDVERVRDIDVEELSRRYFAPEEAAALLALPSDARRVAFFSCWTRKEAYLKAIGAGLTTRLDSFAVSVAPGDPPRLLRVDDAPEAPGAWGLKDVSDTPRYAATLAAERHDWQLVISPWAPAAGP